MLRKMKTRELVMVVVTLAIYVVSVFSITLMYEARIDAEKKAYEKRLAADVEKAVEHAKNKTTGEYANHVATYEAFEDGRVKITTIQPYMRIINDFTVIVSSHSDEAVIEAIKKGE